MAEERNLAAKYSKHVDERFKRESQATLVVNNDYDFVGVRTVNVYSIPVVPLVDFNREGQGNRYGIPQNLGRNVQTLSVSRDRGCTFNIDKGDHIQSQMVTEVGRAVRRETDQMWVPEFDAYVFRKLAVVATERGNYSTEEITKENAYEMFLRAMEHMGNKNVPDKGRVALCSYAFANLLKQDPAFVKQGDKSQEMLSKGVIGEVDGCKIVRVPSSRLPAGCAFILTHKIAATAPKQLEELKIHEKPQGYSGWLVELRFIYDCFVLKEKADAIYYHGSQPVLRSLDVVFAAQTNGKYRIVVSPEAESGHIWYYKLGAAATNVTYEMDVTGWTKLTENGLEVALGSNKAVTVAEATAAGKAKAVGVGFA